MSITAKTSVLLELSLSLFLSLSPSPPLPLSLSHLYAPNLETHTKNPHTTPLTTSTRYLVLLGLAVSPTHQRLGLGSLLIREGLAVADAVGAKTYVESSPVGERVYSKHGFKHIDEVLVDMRRYGGKGVAVQKCMVRDVSGG